MLLILIFLVLEADRFRIYEVSRRRVGLLERGFFPSVLHGDTDWPWVKPLVDHLENPRSPLGRWTAVGWRLRRTYLWICLADLVAWLIKLDLAGGQASDLGMLVSRATVGPLPGWAVFASVTVFYLGLIALTIMAVRRYPNAEDW